MKPVALLVAMFAAVLCFACSGSSETTTEASNEPAPQAETTTEESIEPESEPRQKAQPAKTKREAQPAPKPEPMPDQSDLFMQTYDLSREICRDGGTLQELAEGYGAVGTDLESIAEAYAEGYNAAHRDYAHEGCLLGLTER